MTIRLHVERLILDGFALNGAERVQLERAVTDELTRLLTRPRAPLFLARAGGETAPALRAAAVRLGTGEPASSLGTQVAQSVYEAIVPTMAVGDAGRLGSGSSRESVR